MMQTNSNADDREVATTLGGVIVRGERNMLADAAAPGIPGARAAIETFYYAFNIRSLDLMRQIWADDPLVQLDTPLASLRGSASIAALYERGFSGPMRIESALEDIVAYVAPGLAVFTGRERGTYNTRDSEQGAMSVVPEVRTTCICIFRFIAEQGGWRQVYHHVALDDPDQLARFQRAARGG